MVVSGQTRLEGLYMRLAVLSDIHGNLTALNVVLDDLAASGPFDVTWCLGDLAAFGPRPLECVDVIRRLAETDEGKTFKVIGGNTDRYLIGGERLRVGAAQDEAELKRLAGELQTRDTMLNWSMGALDWENYKFLRTILRRELATNVPGYGVVLGFHAVPGDDEAFLTDSTPDELVADIMLDREGRLGIGGHTHRQLNRLAGGWHIVNPGAVGLSFDRPGFAQYTILSFEDGEVSIDLRNLPYDIDAVVEDARDVGHPNPNWLSGKLRPNG
ncbi:MAG: metallophosphoesterase family protein [Anaerolineae bacterium]|nr:metallophosphoesterase [Chloroflexota bacterium]MCO6445368.1 metallophosphoesterase family protein [Anaerolineae bacterium]